MPAITAVTANTVESSADSANHSHARLPNSNWSWPSARLPAVKPIAPPVAIRQPSTSGWTFFTIRSPASR